VGQVLRMSAPALDLMLYGNKSELVNNYLVQQMQQVRPAFNEFSNRIYQSLQSSYNFLNDKLVQYGIMNQLQQQGVQMVDNYYMELNSFTALQNANVTMQRWVMHHPQLRQLYLDQNIDGYSDTYQNVFGKDVGEADYGYRRVMDGAIQDTDNGWVVKHYIEDLLPGDKQPDHREQVIIRHTYDTVDHILSTCKFDFSCKSEEPTKRNG
jgi:hypothetical protein